jgi:RNA-directed DNA polymerase
MSTKLNRIAEKAQENPKLRFTSLAHILTPEFLKETWSKLNRRGAAGVDGQTAKEFERHLDKHITDVYERLRTKKYRAQPVRRAEIPKGNGKFRPLGIPTLEDRLIQAAVARILNALYEPLFLDCSYGFRPGKRAHDAIYALRNYIMAGGVMHIFEADIRSYFDRVNHDWLRKMLRLRVSDSIILRLIDKWLRAGVMDEGLVKPTEEGVPQGGPISPILSNIYLHYVLDLWFEKVVKSACQGKAYLVRYADDWVAGFQLAKDLQRFSRVSNKRLNKFSLELSPEKTRSIVFGRYAKQRRKKVEEFTFLGFRHICGKDRKGNFAIIRLPADDRLRRFRQRVKEWLNLHKHWRVQEQQEHLSKMLQGFYQYYGVPHSIRKLQLLIPDVEKYWKRALKRRSQRSKAYWSRLNRMPWFNLPQPLVYHQRI